MVKTRSKKNATALQIKKDIEQNLSDVYVMEGDIKLKVMLKSIEELSIEERDDFDYYEPIDELKEYPLEMLYSLDDVLDFSEESRDPSNDETSTFKYIEISSIDLMAGEISEPTEIPCDEEYVPSRARKVVHAGDLIISTVRPTRKAIAKIDKSLDNQICSTGFSVVRPKNGVDIDYLHYILRTDLAAKQFGKFASGSSYPAILDKHIKMTIVPIPDDITQKEISEKWKLSIQEIKRIQKEMKDMIDEFITSANQKVKSASPGKIVKEQKPKLQQKTLMSVEVMVAD